MDVEADWMPVSPAFFGTLKIPFIAGRNFAERDFDRAAAQDAAERAQMDARAAKAPMPPGPKVPLPVIVNALFAQKVLTGLNPIGQRFGAETGDDPERPPNPGYEVIGIVGNAKYNSLRREIDPTMYVPLTGGSATFEVRTAGDPKAFIAPIRNVINQRDANLPMIRVATQTEQIDRLLRQERIIAQLSTVFGLLALVLACVGIYGLLSYEVTRRTREIGIRMALGARRNDIITMVIRQGLVLALAGTVVGVAASVAISKLLKSLLYGIEPGDPLTIVGVVVLLVSVALVAAFVPARRATTVDPMIALRYE